MSEKSFFVPSVDISVSLATLVASIIDNDLHFMQINIKEAMSHGQCLLFRLSKHPVFPVIKFLET